MTCHIDGDRLRALRFDHGASLELDPVRRVLVPRAPFGLPVLARAPYCGEQDADDVQVEVGRDEVGEDPRVRGGKYDDNGDDV